MPKTRSKSRRKTTRKPARPARSKRPAARVHKPRPAAKKARRPAKAPRAAPKKPKAAPRRSLEFRTAPARHRCSALDPFGGPCENIPRPGTDRCTIHTPNPVG